MEIRDIIELMQAVAENNLTKFELELGDCKVAMKREKKMVTISEQSTWEESKVISSEKEKADSMVYTESDHKITCPLVGTFYSAPSPDAEHFVRVGDHVKKGQVVGIVEAMKLMNEIESEYDGVVEAVLVENEATVEYGQPLFVIR